MIITRLQAQRGDRIQLHFASHTADGAVLESTFGRKPIEVTLGDPELLPLLSSSLTGMSAGQQVQVTLLPEEAFGTRQLHLSQSVPTRLLPAQADVGDQLLVDQRGDPFDAWILRREGDRAIVDANHPLVGEKIIFTLRIEEICRDES